jgi:hypothetical protein
VVAHPLKEVAVIKRSVPTGIPVIDSLPNDPADTSIPPLLLYVTLYVLPLQIGLLTISIGAILIGDKIVICCELQPLNDDVTVTGFPVGIPVIAVAVTVPKEEEIIAPLGLLILIL